MKRGLTLLILFLGIFGARADEEWSMAFYAVQSGDEIGEIGERYGISTGVMKQLNLLQGDQLIPGQILCFPMVGHSAIEIGSFFLSPNESRITYTAHHFSVPERLLMSLNELPKSEIVRKGQILMIPARSAVSILADPAMLLADGYVTQIGDTLSAIAAAFHIEEDELCAANGPYADGILPPGLILHLGRVERECSRNGYAVQKGDTLSRIAGKFSISKEALIAINDLPDPHCLVQGQILILP